MIQIVIIPPATTQNRCHRVFDESVPGLILGKLCNDIFEGSQISQQRTKNTMAKSPEHIEIMKHITVDQIISKIKYER